jgi:hypothetical protein
MNGTRRMPLTRSFGELAQKRIGRDSAFGDASLREGIDPGPPERPYEH